MDLTFIAIIIGMIVELFFIKLFSILITALISMYCSLVVLHYKDFDQLKNKVFKVLSNLKDMDHTYDEVWLRRDLIFEVSLDLQVLNHSYAEICIREIGNKLLKYTEKNKETPTEFTKMCLRALREKCPKINIPNPDYIYIPDKILENALKDVKKLKPNWCVIFKPF